MKKIALSLLVIAASGAYVWSQAGIETTDSLPGLPPLVGNATAAPMPPSTPTASDNAATGFDQPLPPDQGASPDGIGDGNDSTTSLASTPPAGLSGLIAALPSDDLAAPPEPPPLPAPTPAAPPPSTPTAAETPPPVEIPIPRPRPSYRPSVASEPPRRQPTTGGGVTPAALTLASNGMYADGDYTGPIADAYYGLVQIEAIVRGGKLDSIKVLRYPSDRRTSRFINRFALPRLGREVVRAQTANVNIISGATLTSEAFIQSLDGALRQARA